MRPYAFIALGLCFTLMGAGLFALTLRQPKDAKGPPSKAQRREEAALAAENRKMRLGAAVALGAGALFIVWAFF